MKNNFIYFKGPSKDKILKNIKGKTLDEKFYIACKNRIYWLLEQCLKENYKPDIFEDNLHVKNGDNHITYFLTYNNEIRNLLVKYKKYHDKFNF
jgi:hypothetical protein